jgi:hypothetical protein
MSGWEGKEAWGKSDENTYTVLDPSFYEVLFRVPCHYANAERITIITVYRTFGTSGECLVSATATASCLARNLGCTRAISSPQASMSGVPAASFLAPRSIRDTVTFNPRSSSYPQARASTGVSTTTVPSRPLTSTSHPKFGSTFNAALEGYKRKTKNDLASHPLLPILQSCNSPEAILTVLRRQIPAFSESHNGDDRLTKWVTPIVKVLYSFSTALGGDVGLVNIGMSLVKKLLL